MKSNGIEHTLCPPYHRSSNGLAEKNAQAFKRMFKKSDNSLSLQHRVAKVLLNYRNTPHAITGITPTELFLNRTTKTRLSFVKPCLQRKVKKKQIASKFQHDGFHPSVRQYDMYQPVRVRNLRGGKEKWTPGTIVSIKGPKTYRVRRPGNNRRYVHTDHLITDDSREQTPKPREREREREREITYLRYN